MYDAIIIGCGPAGMTAAIYLLRSGKSVLILEKEGIGGQIASTPLIENYPGFMSISGAEFANNLYEQVTILGGEIELEEVIKIENGEIKKVITSENVYNAKTIVIATGAKYRTLGLEKEEEFIGNGISFCTTCDAPFFKDKVVAVVGGKNTAVTNALYLSEICKKVYLIHRKDKFDAEQILIDKLDKKKNIEKLMGYNVTKLVGKTNLEEIVISNSNEEEHIKVDGMFLSIGHIPQNELARNLLNLSENEYILGDESCKTNIEGIFVIGDIREKKVRQLTTATSDGTICAINVNKYLQ